MESVITLPVGWILTSIGVLCGTIGTLTVTFYKFLQGRLEAQDKILTMQDAQIGSLHAEIIRLSQGCGIESCLWRQTAKQYNPKP